MQGDLIPWTVGQQFQDPDFPSLSGARIVRLAVHPELPRAGYGTRCVPAQQHSVCMVSSFPGRAHKTRACMRLLVPLLEMQGCASANSIVAHASLGLGGSEELQGSCNAGFARRSQAGLFSRHAITVLSSNGHTHTTHLKRCCAMLGCTRRCIELLKRYYQGEVASLDEDGVEGEDEEDEEARGEGENSEDEEGQGSKKKNKKQKGEDGGSKQLEKGECLSCTSTKQGEGTLLSETMGPRKRLPPLLVPLTDRKPERLHYLGVVNAQMLSMLHHADDADRFGSPSETTGEHTVVMLCALEHFEVEGGTAWLQPFVTDFKVCVRVGVGM
eukprot:scaffold111419_cov20-Tisochrysis_lutea.AAC.1